MSTPNPGETWREKHGRRRVNAFVRECGGERVRWISDDQAVSCDEPLAGFLEEFEFAKARPLALPLACPECKAPHVDRDEWATTRTHTEHLCAACGHKWTPMFGVPTVGIEPEAATAEQRANDRATYFDLTPSPISFLDMLDSGRAQLELGRDHIAVVPANTGSSLLDMMRKAEP